MTYFWLAIVLILTVIEATTCCLVSIWFIISGIITLLLSCFIDNFIIQLSIFIVLGILLLLLTKKTIKTLHIPDEKTNLDRVVGMQGIVTEEIDKLTVGEVKVDGKKWSATSKEKLKVGSIVKILKINGVKLEVESWEE